MLPIMIIFIPKNFFKKLHFLLYLKKLVYFFKNAFDSDFLKKIIVLKNQF